MTAIPELEGPTLERAVTTRLGGCALVEKKAIEAEPAGTLYSFLDVSDLFDEFVDRLGRVATIGQVHLENTSFDISLTRQFASGLLLNRDFMLRFTMEHQGQVLGTLLVSRSHQFLSAEIRSIQRLVDTLHGPLFNAIKHLRVWQLAYHDALTGVRNRASLDLLLSETEKCENIASMLVCDVDSFKSINDRFGHAAGDEVLCQFARLLSDATAQKGTVYRYGGDEFVVVIHTARADGGEGIAEQILQRVMDYPFSTNGHTFSVTATIGLTEVRPCESLDDCFLRADSALLHGKRTTKNRLVCA